MHDVGGQVAELLGDVLGGVGPHAVAVRVVGAPHERLHAHVVDQLGADAVELERGLALPPPVVARLHLEAEVGEAVLPLEVHAVERVGYPADAALAEGDAHVGILRRQILKWNDSGKIIIEGLKSRFAFRFPVMMQLAIEYILDEEDLNWKGLNRTHTFLN